MDLFVERVDVWAATIEDNPVVSPTCWLSCGTRRQTCSHYCAAVSDQPDKGMLFVTPLQCDREGAVPRSAVPVRCGLRS